MQLNDAGCLGAAEAMPPKEGKGIKLGMNSSHSYVCLRVAGFAKVKNGSKMGRMTCSS